MRVTGLLLIFGVLLVFSCQKKPITSKKNNVSNSDSTFVNKKEELEKKEEKTVINSILTKKDSTQKQLKEKKENSTSKRLGKDSLKIVVSPYDNYIKSVKNLRKSLEKITGKPKTEYWAKTISLMKTLEDTLQNDKDLWLRTSELIVNPEAVQTINQLSDGLNSLQDTTSQISSAEILNLFNSPANAEALTNLIYWLTLVDSEENYDGFAFFEELEELIVNQKNTSKNIEVEEKVKSTTTQVQTTIDYNAEKQQFDAANQKMYLEGKAEVIYGNKKLEAEIIEISYDKSLVKAYGKQDSTGQWGGLPVFTEESVVYNAEEITYNYKTEKGIIKGIVTEQGDGLVRSETVKKTPDDVLFMKNNIYTTCDNTEPHYGIRSKKIKTAVNKYVISGPANLEINGVPLPLGLPFGLFPASNKRTSGIIVPQYGESADRGFFLRNGGFYWAVNDYVGLKFIGEIYSLGGWGGTFDANYKKRYAYNGNLNLSLRNVVRENNDLTKDITTDYWLRWSHSPQTKKSSRFSANVNAGTSTYNRNNSTNLDNYLSATFNSNISYNKTFQGTPFSFSANLRHNQNTLTNIVTLNPEANLTMSRVNPFQKKGSSGKGLLKQLNFSYTFNSKGEVTNAPKSSGRFPFSNIYQPDTQDTDSEPDTLDFFREFPQVLKNFTYGGVHRIPISSSATILKFLSFSPSINYTEYWYPYKYDFTWLEEENAVKVDTISTLGRAYNFSASAGLSTTLYGMYAFKNGTVIRHMMRPNISASFTPDFSDPLFNLFQEVQVDSTGTTRKVSRVHGGNMGGPSTNKSASLSFSLNNQLEMKVKDKKDSTQQMKKITILDNFNFSSGYNFVADSINLSDISISARTKLFNKLTLNFSSALDPYHYEITGRDPETNKVTSQYRSRFYAWQKGNGIGQLKQARVAASIQLKPPSSKSKNSKPSLKEEVDDENLTEIEQQVLEDIANNPNLYVDFSIPWSLSLNYNINYTKTGFLDSKVVQTLTFNGDFSLTPKWKISYRSGYDFEKKELSMTTISIHRDLHCWQMNLTWVPFGPRQSYTFEIGVKSSLLQDLKINKRNSWLDRSF